ncbi:hypothetical protein [Polaromonas sp.]|uniref:hypothetical protein n=1 Tax=Polaromonas sp. TaxID=1869339 RepID=UPI0017CF404A|nr:hypothetical protein [Polaromonas sp.]NML85778.1 hypothetical protein [Polaromonas sp.]
MTKAKTPAGTAKHLQLTCAPSQTTAQVLSRAALQPCINGASVIEAFQGNIMGKEVDLGELVAGLSESCTGVKGGDLSILESMLVGQATALQTIFASLARRAATQENLRQYETFMGLALKAQSQSRATISALVDLKYPRQATFVRQANIAHGPQQVNNGAAARDDLKQSARERKKGKPPSEQNKLLKAQRG